MYKWFLASRYLRSRAISFVTIVGIFLSVGALIVVISVMSGFLRESRSFIRGTMSDVVVAPILRLTQMPDGSLAKKQFNDFRPMEEVIRGVPEVSGVAPRFSRPSLIRRSDGRDMMSGLGNVVDNMVNAVGIDLEREYEVTGIRKYLLGVENLTARVEDVERPFFLPDDLKPDEYFTADFPCALVGEGKFKRLRLKRGDVITLATLDEEALEAGEGGEIKPFEQKFFVAGAFRSGHFHFDSQHILIDIDDARTWVGAGKNEITEVYVSVEDYDKNGLTTAAALDLALERAGMPSYVATWEQKNAVFLGAVQNERTILGFILGFFILIATFNVFANTSMMVTDKTRDIGILVSMGATPSGVLGIFLSCGVLMWMIGAALGAVAGYLFASYINPIKDFIEKTLDVEIFRKDVYNFTDIPVEINAAFIVATVMCTLLLCLFFSFIPALRASLMDPVRTLRHE